MGTELTFDQARGFVRIRLTGTLTERVILDAFDAAVTNESYLPGMGRLWDFLEGDLSAMTTQVIAAMAQHSLRYPPGVNDVKVAFVVGRELEYGLSRMFEAFSMDARTDIAVFYSLDEAEVWLIGGAETG